MKRLTLESSTIQNCFAMIDNYRSSGTKRGII